MNAALPIATLLAPIAGPNPAGSDGRELINSRYHACKAARNNARAAERSEMFDGGSERATEAWREVMALAPALLAEDSKDLEVACWYAEASLRRQGFGGLADAFAVMHGIIENFWENFYPRPDEDGLETQLTPLAGLNGEGAEGVLIAPLRNVVITNSANAGPFTYWDYRQAVDADRLTDEKAKTKRLQQLGFDVAAIEQAVAESSLDFLLQLRDDLQRCREEFTGLHAALEAKVGAVNAPPSSNILNVLQEVLGAVEHLGRNRWPLATEAEAPAAEETAAEPDASAQASASRPGSVNSRAEAFRQLQTLADYFRTHEPHSPVAYLLDKAVSWGQLPLHELLEELIPDNSARQHFSLVTGVRKTGA